MLGLGPPCCCTQWETAAKMGVIWLKYMLWLPRFSMDIVLLICVCLSSRQSSGPVTEWAAEPAPELMEIPFTLFGSLAKLHSHQWLRIYFYFCTSVLDLLNMFLPTSSHQKGRHLYVCVQDSSAQIVAVLPWCHQQKKDLLLQLRSLKSLMTDVKPSKTAAWGPDSALG